MISFEKHPVANGYNVRTTDADAIALLRTMFKSHVERISNDLFFVKHSAVNKMRLSELVQRLNPAAPIDIGTHLQDFLEMEFDKIDENTRLGVLRAISFYDQPPSGYFIHNMQLVTRMCELRMILVDRLGPDASRMFDVYAVEVIRGLLKRIRESRVITTDCKQSIFNLVQLMNQRVQDARKGSVH